MATCPLCKDYEGPPGGVEGHISGSRDEIHSGEWGSAWRDEIAGPFEDNDGDPFENGGDETGTAGASTSDVDGKEVAGEVGRGGSLSEGVGSTSSDAMDESAVDSALGSDIDPATALLVATALFALFVLVGVALSDEDDGDELVESDQNESVEETGEPETSLIE